MALSNIFAIARSALMTHQRAMNITANNIANAQTPGYTRQRLVLGSPGFGSGFSFGTGVNSTGIERIRDPFLDASYRREAGFLGTSTTMRHFLQQVEAAVNEPSDSGVSAALDSMFSAFGDLANDPHSAASREQVRRAAERFAYQLNHLSDSVRGTMDASVEKMQAEVAEVNALTERIAKLNEQILVTEKTTGPSPELLDQRDQLLDTLSGYLSIDVSQADNGTLTVSTDGMTLVSGSSSFGVEVRPLQGGGVGVGPASGKEVLDIQSGSLKGLTDLTTKELPDFLARLDTLAEAVVTEVNAIHRSGYNASGSTGVDFFDASGLTAGTIALSTAVDASASAIAAGTSAESGNNAVAMDLAALGQKGIDALDGQTFVDHYAAFAATVGRSVLDSMQDETASQSLVISADTWRSSVGGVSVDEEMVNMIGQQEAYTAAARLINVADQMIQEILNIAS